MNKMVKLLMLLVFCGTTLCSLSAQKVSGRVVDAVSSEPVPFASVHVKDTDEGVICDEEGDFLIYANPGVTLVFSCVGYEAVELPSKPSSSMRVSLTSVSKMMDDVVVIGYGLQRKSQVTGAIASIENYDLRNQAVSNLASAMVGRASGINIITPSGTPGAALLVNVRGNLNPLYVIDGVPLLSENNSSLLTAFDLEGFDTGSGQTISSISDLNPNDIDRIEVLKDASATAIYGARAANGVILVTTKRGKEGTTNFNFNYYTGLQRLSREIPFLNSRQFVDLVNEARANDLAKYNADPAYFGEDFDPSVLTRPMIGFATAKSPNTNWIQAVTRTAPVSNYELSVKGGSNKTRFYMSGGYFDQQGVVIESWFRRANIRLNVDHKVSDRFSTGATISLSRSVNRRSFNDNTYTGVITNAIGASPLMPVYEADGSYANYEDYQVYWLSDNPVKSAKEIRAYTTTLRTIASAYAEFRLTKDLRIKSTLSADMNNLRDDQFKSAITNDAQTVGGKAFESNFNNFLWLNENTITYTKAFGKQNISLLAGFTAQSSASRLAVTEGQGFPSGPLTNISSAATITRATSTGESFALLSYLVRANYDIKNRYLLTATMRADASSRFSKNNRTGYFPSVAVAWRMVEEPFMSDIRSINELKLRVSYGITGDQEIGNYQNVTFYAPSGYNGQAGIMLSSLADPSLSWQSNKMFNAGLDFEFWRGRLNGTFEFFKGTKTSILSNDVIPGTSGFNTLVRNSGEVDNEGVELMLGYTLVDNRRVRWTLTANGSYIKSTITKLTSDNVLMSVYSDFANTHVLKVGYPVGTFWGIKYTGVDVQTGDATYEDLNGDGSIDADDAQPLGQALPKYFGGLNNNFRFDNFDCNFFVIYAGGNKVYNLIRSTYDNLGWSNDGDVYAVYANNSTNVENRWRKPGDVAEYPRATFVFKQLEEGSSAFIEDGSFLRLQQINVGYTFKTANRVNGTRLYIQGNNIYVLTKYKGFDPEVSSNGASTVKTAGVDFGAYPKARTILVGVNLSF